ncbi:MAG: hypothetical protein PHF18_18085, partial [Methanosarcina sp.]|uniref:hypothetical protein n=1 Tax=Methanosarcina sp. TaxID=2213 RepID=UPI002605345F
VTPLDLSEYNGHKPQVKKEPLSAEALEMTYPYIIALNESEKNEFNRIFRESSLDEFFSAYPAARGNETIRSFIEAYAPKKWDGSQINQSFSLVYLISGAGPFRELMFLEKNGSIVQIQTFDESGVSVNRTKALGIAAAEINSSISPADVRVVFRGSEAFWAVSYMEGPTVTTVFVDTENGVLYYYLSEAEDKSESSFPEIPGFTGGLFLTGILGTLWLLVSGRRVKLDFQRCMIFRYQAAEFVYY